MANLTKPTNNLISNIYANSKMPKPEVGMGATILMYTDRHAATIVEIVETDKKSGLPTEILIQEDSVKAAKPNSQMGHQDWEITPCPDAPKTAYTLRKNGRWIRKGDSMKNGQCIAVGVRDHYHDWEF